MHDVERPTEDDHIWAECLCCGRPILFKGNKSKRGGFSGWCPERHMTAHIHADGIEDFVKRWMDLTLEMEARD